MNEVSQVSEVKLAGPHDVDDSLWAAVQRNRSALTIIGAAALFVIALLAHSSAMRGDFIWDDDYYVTDNTALRSWDGLQDIWTPGKTVQYYPMTHTSFWLEYRLWGMSPDKVNPLPFHITNVLLHAGSALMLWVILRRLNIPGAWAAAAIFAVHPMNVESVAWITERKNVLSLAFYLGAMMVYLRYCGVTPPRADFDKRKEWISLPDDPTRVYALAMFLFACALLSKSVTFSLPAAVLVIIWWKRGRITWDDVVPLLPMFGLGILMGWVTTHYEMSPANVGAWGKDFDYAPTLAGEITYRVLIAGRVIWFYAVKIVFPYPLIFNYPRWNVSLASAWQFLFPVCAVASLAALWALRRRIGRGPLAASLFYVGTLFPALGFINVFPMQYSFVADHFAYHASIGLIVLIVACAARLIEMLVRVEILFPVAAPAATGVLLGAFAMMTWRQGLIYKDQRALWEDTIRKTDQKSWFAANNYGVWLMRDGARMVRGSPERQNRMEAAVLWFNKTIKLKSDHHKARFNLGLIAESYRDLPRALEFYEKAVELEPRDALPRLKAAEVLGLLARPRDALEQYKKVVELETEFGLSDRRDLAFRAYMNMGTIFDAANQPREAVAAYREALLLRPEDVRGHLKLGNALISMGEIPLALTEFAQVVRLDEKNAAVRNSLGGLMAAGGKLNEAEAQFRLAVEYAPRYPEAHNNLGQVYMMKGKVEDAIVHFKRALELAPSFEKAKSNLDEALERLTNPGSATRPTSWPAATPSTVPTD